MKTNEPSPFPKMLLTRIEPMRRRHPDETPVGVPATPTRAARKTPESMPEAIAELEAARRRIDQLEIVLRESRSETQRLRLEMTALARLEPEQTPPPSPAPLVAPSFALGLVALVAGTALGLASGEPLVALVSGLGSFSAIVFASSWTERKA